MSSLMLHPVYNLYEKKGVALCSSVQVAEEFEKRHKNVLRDIRNLDCSNIFRKNNLSLIAREITFGVNRTRTEPIYYMTDYGFVFLAMAYRTSRCALIRESIIERFDSMKKSIMKYAITRSDFPEFTQAVEAMYDEPRSYYYNTEIDMIRRIVLGSNLSISNEQANAIRNLQQEDIKLLHKNVDYQERKLILSDFYSFVMNGHSFLFETEEQQTDEEDKFNISLQKESSGTEDLQENFDKKYTIGEKELLARLDFKRSTKEWEWFNVGEVYEIIEGNLIGCISQIGKVLVKLARENKQIRTHRVNQKKYYLLPLIH